MLKIQFCCGETKLDGWINLDVEIDISKPLPYESGAVDYIYCEHGIEHVTQKEAWGFLEECNRILRNGGKIRIAFPDIYQIVLGNSPEYNTFITGLAESMRMPFKKTSDIKETIRTDLALLEKAADAARCLRKAIAEAVVGQSEVVDAMLITLAARGHALLVGVPGLAKTLLVASLAQALDLSFGRVQFTPDLLPADITGTDVLHEFDPDDDPSEPQRRRLRFLPGPIFANLVLADEINRTPPKTQAALLQAMQERKVTVGTATHALPDPFQVFATRNPIEQEGTYPLPEAQLDRFLLEIHVDYPSESDEFQVARRTTSGRTPKIAPVLRAADVRALGALIPRIPATDEAVSLAVRLARATRPAEAAAPREVREYVRFGAGPRGSQALVLSAKARAALRGEAAADVDDVRAMLVPALRHRLVLSYRAEADAVREHDILMAVRRAVD